MLASYSAAYSYSIVFMGCRYGINNTLYKFFCCSVSHWFWKLRFRTVGRKRLGSKL